MQIDSSLNHDHIKINIEKAVIVIRCHHLTVTIALTFMIDLGVLTALNVLGGVRNYITGKQEGVLSP